jgi:RecB family exonuclease
MPDDAPLQLVVAAGAARLQQQMLSELQEEAAAPQWLLVPSTALVDHLRRAAAWQSGCAPDIRPLSFLELAQRLTAAERRRDGRVLLSPHAAGWLARRHLDRRRLPAGFFDKVLHVRGFRGALLRAFDELAHAGLVSSAAVERFLVRHAATLPFRARHALELLHGWRQSFEDTHDDPAAVLARAIAVLRAGTAPPGSLIPLRVVGFQSFRPLERRLLEALAQRDGQRLQVWLTTPAHAVLQRSADWSAHGFTLRRVASDDGSTPVVRALSAPGEESEAIEVGRRLLAASQRGVPLHRMAVLTRSARSHALLRDTWRRIGIPCESIPGQPLLQLRAGRALMLFLSLAESGLTPRLAMDFLDLAPLRWRLWEELPEDPVPSSWSRVATAARLADGIEDWRTRLPRFRDEVLEQAARFSSSGEPNARVQRLAESASQLLLVGERLHGMLQSVPERGRWRDFVRCVLQDVLSLFEREPETLEIESALRGLASLEIRGHGRASRAEFRDAVRQVLGRTSLPFVADAHRGAVTLGTEESLRGMAFDLVVLMGLRDGEWPAVVSEDPILSDADRRLLGTALGDEAALVTRADLMQLEMVRFQEALTRGARSVVMTYARLDPTTGATRLPSTLLMQWAQEEAGSRIDYAGFEALPQVERVPLTRREAPESGPLVGVEEVDALALAALDHSAARKYVRRIGELPRRGLLLDTMRNRRRRYTAFDGMLRSPDVQRSLESSLRSRTWSISQVNTWATCPFRFFMRRMLQLEPLDLDSGRELDALTIGRLVHEILERFHLRLQDRRITPQDTSFDILQRELEGAARQVFASLEGRGQTGSRLLWQLRKQTLLEDLTLYVRQELRRGEWGRWWQPAAFELAFGPGEEQQLEVNGNGFQLPFRGFIDRLDRHTQHSGVLVIDYKSGRKTSTSHSPAAGQLVVYLLAATAGDGAVLDHSEARFVHVTRRGGFAVQRMAGDAVRRRRQDFDHLVVAVASGAAEGDFHPEPGDKGTHCRFCDYRGICDSRIVQQSERKAAAGQAERYATLPDFSDLLHDLPMPPAGGEADA